MPLPLSLLRAKAAGNTIRLQLRCEWPAGTQCPGQILVRARIRQRSVVRFRGRRVVKTRVVRRAIVRRGFRLTGGMSHTFRLGLGSGGRRLTEDGAKPWAQLVVAIPGGSVGRAVRLR